MSDHFEREFRQNANEIVENHIRGNTKTAAAYFKGMVEEGLRNLCRGSPLVFVFAGAVITDFDDNTTYKKLEESILGVFQTPKIKGVMEKNRLYLTSRDDGKGAPMGIRELVLKKKNPDGGEEDTLSVHVMWACIYNHKVISEFQKKEKEKK